MEKLKFKKLTESELSQIRGGKWVIVNGDWVWIEDQAIDNSKDSFDSVSAFRKHSYKIQIKAMPETVRRRKF